MAKTVINPIMTGIIATSQTTTGITAINPTTTVINQIITGMVAIALIITGMVAIDLAITGITAPVQIITIGREMTAMIAIPIRNLSCGSYLIC
jgi:hypothetical protein